MKIVIRDDIQQTLKKYNIEYEKYLKLENTPENVNNLLINIDLGMTDFRDENDEPLKEWLELEKAYDIIYNDN